MRRRFPVHLRKLPLGGMLHDLEKLARTMDALAKEGEVRKVSKEGPVTVEYHRTVRYIRPEPGAPAPEAPRIELKPKPIEVEAPPKESLVDVFDRGDYISVVVELPGVNEDDIKFETTGSTLRIKIHTASGDVEREISIAGAEEVKGIMGASFKNGILEIKLSKRLRNSKENVEKGTGEFDGGG